MCHRLSGTFAAACTQYNLHMTRAVFARELTNGSTRCQMHDCLLAGGHVALVAVVLTLLRRLPTGLHAPQPTSGGSSLWAGVPSVGGETDPDAAALRKALLSVLRRVSENLAMMPAPRQGW